MIDTLPYVHENRSKSRKKAIIKNGLLSISNGGTLCMPLLRPNAPFPVCPRCKAVLPHDAVVCSRCGYHFQVGQTKMSGVQQQIVQSGYQVNQTNQMNQARQFNQANHANRANQYNQMPVNRMQPGRIPVNEIQSAYQVDGQPVRHLSPEKMPVTGTDLQRGYQDVPHMGNMQASRMPVTGTDLQRGYQNIPQSGNMQIGGLSGARTQAGYPFNQSTTDAFQVNRIPMEGMQPGYSAHRVTSNRVQSVNISPSIQPRAAYNAKKDERSQSQTKRALTYFVCVILATSALVFVVFHEAGESILSLIAHPTSTHTVTTTYLLPKGTPLFADAFSSDASGWNLQSVPGSYQVVVGNGKMTLEDDKNSLLWELLPGEQTYDNFILSVNATLSKGDPNNGYGVYIRGTSDAQSDLATYYRFELYGDSSYAIFKGVTNQSGVSTEVKLTDFIVNPAIQKLDKLNHIMIIAKGSTLSFIVNGQLLTTIKDRSYASGSIALFVSNLPGTKPGAQVQFSQLAVYPD